MNQKIIIPLLIVFATAVGIFLYLQYSSKVEEQINIEQNRLSEEKDRKERLELEISELKSKIEKWETDVEELNEHVSSSNTSNDDLKATKEKLESRLNSFSYLLVKERNKISNSKSQIIALINKQMAKLLDHRIRRLSIFNDDSSFAYYTGRRNYIALDAKSNLKMERTIHFTSTGQYLQNIYQDSDNGNNRFLITTYNTALKNLDLNSASIMDLSKAENPSFDNDLREETYINLEIPIVSSVGQVSVTNSVEYNDEEFEKFTKEKSINFYTTSIDEAEDILSLLKILNTLD